MTPILSIRTYGDPVLRKKSTPIEEVGLAERVFIESLMKTMYEKDGVGLAAPQVGVNQRVFVADMGEGPSVFVNPRVVKAKGDIFLEEGCLSVPGIVVNIKRPEGISVEYTDMDNRLVKREFSGLMAKIFQHENDHLDGKLIVDYAEGEEREKIEEYFKEQQAEP